MVSSGLAKTHSLICMLHKRTDTYLFSLSQCGFKVSLAAQAMSYTAATRINTLVSEGKEK
jgi:hypothetical protein